MWVRWLVASVWLAGCEPAAPPLLVVPLGVPQGMVEPPDWSAGPRVGSGVWPVRPEIPAVLPDLVLIEHGAYTRPTLAPHRTSGDGRVGVYLAEPEIFLMGPEELSLPLPLSAPGTRGVLASQVLTPDDLFDPAVYQAAGYDEVEVAQHTLCDPVLTRADRLPEGMPLPCADDPSRDCYDLTLVTVVEYRSTIDARETQLWSVDLHVRVASPKTTEAAIESWSLGAPVAGPVLYARSAFEPMFTEDGRLLVLRAAKTRRDPNTGADLSEPLDVVYATIPESGTACALGELGPFRPLSHAHHDDQMRGRYGLATFPLRDPLGEPIADGVDARISYPWIDRKGNNLFFTTIGAPNAVVYDGVEGQRYAASCAHAECVEPQGVGEEPVLNFRGYGVVGLWTRGKMVLLDAAFNNTDYGFLRRRDGHLDLQLYEPSTNPDPGTRSDGWVEVASGRDVSTGDVPELSTRNTSVLESPEAIWNYDPDLRPTRVRDVVWHVTTGRTTDQVVFDDLLNEDVLLSVDMVGALHHASGQNGFLHYYDGWLRADATNWTVTEAGPAHVRLQNAATSTRWQVPPYGTVEGPVRLEPVAAGGVIGKGLWLDGAWARARFSIPDQPSSLADEPWFVGLFVDPRFADDRRERSLLTLPDGGSVALHGLSGVWVRDASGALQASMPLGELALRRGAYAHLGLRVDPEAGEVELYVDGYLAQTATGVDGLALVGGDLVLGDGFRGWVDELKLIVAESDPELLCNHAHGTLVGLDAASSSRWWDVAGRYPSHAAISDRLAVSGQPTFERYACVVEHADPDGVMLEDLDAPSIRQALLVPEGGLVHDQPRPDSSTNPFCLSCHSDLQGPLSIDALVADLDGLPMTEDPRRQPLQPPRLIFGNVPMDFFGPGEPPQDLHDPWTVIDPFVYP